MGRTLNWTVFVAAACGVLYLCLAIVRPFAAAIAWSLVLAIVCYPIHQRLVRKTGRVTLSALLTSMVAVCVLLIPLVVIAGIAVSQTVAIDHAWRAAFQSPDRALPRVSATLASAMAGYGLDRQTIVTSIERQRAIWMQNAGHYSLSLAGGLLEATASSVIVFVLLFLVLRDARQLLSAIPGLLPFEPQRGELLLRRITDVVQASVHGVVVIALMHGAVFALTFWLLGVPWAALWGMVTVFASVFPVVGAFTVWGPVALYLATKDQWMSAVTVIVMAGVVSGLDHVIRPRLVAGRVGLSNLAMFFALFGGVSAFGVLGVVLGPAAFATLAAIVDTLRQPAPAANSA